MAEQWAALLIGQERTEMIATPVYLEIIAGARSKHELNLTRAFLSKFKIIDEGNILSADWKEAVRIASRVPHDVRPRQAIDCLIRAIANRFHVDVRTKDVGFPYRR